MTVLDVGRGHAGPASPWQRIVRNGNTHFQDNATLKVDNPLAECERSEFGKTKYSRFE